MTRREAMRIAHGMAYQAVQHAITAGGNEWRWYPKATEHGQMLIEAALEAIAREHFERGGSQVRPSRLTERYGI